jgi:hypothetical protein
MNPYGAKTRENPEDDLPVYHANCIALGYPGVPLPT